MSQMQNVFYILHCSRDATSEVSFFNVEPVFVRWWNEDTRICTTLNHKLRNGIPLARFGYFNQRRGGGYVMYSSAQTLEFNFKRFVRLVKKAYKRDGVSIEWIPDGDAGPSNMKDVRLLNSGRDMLIGTRFDGKPFQIVRHPARSVFTYAILTVIDSEASSKSPGVSLDYEQMIDYITRKAKEYAIVRI